MRVRASDFPEDERLELGDRKFVVLFAKVGGTTKETKILMSDKIANVYVQPDKPLYTPNQMGKHRYSYCGSVKVNGLVGLRER